MFTLVLQGGTNLVATGSDAKPKLGATKDRILTSTLALFNERAPDRVTTSEIARSVGINEGNLYYHFKTKEALVLALFKKFESEAVDLVQASARSTSTEIGVYSGFLRDWFSLVWNFRFLFRDLPALVASAPSLTEPIKAVSSGMQSAVRHMINQMMQAGFISVPEKEQEPLLANVWIVSTYWAVYLGLQEGVVNLKEEHLGWGLNQVSSLFKPYLSGEARDALDNMLSR